MKLWSRIKSIFSRAPQETGTDEEDPEDNFWQQVYAAREQYYREHFGPLPDDILKLGHMFGVWPGGGLYVFPGTALGSEIFVHTTFGLSNSDMPTSTSASNVEVKRDELGRITETSSRLQARPKAAVADGKAGYGYEIMVVTRDNAEWPLWFLQWAVNAEILHDTGFLDRVEKYDGLTIEQIRVGESDSVNVLIAKARSPLPTGIDLPNGRMDFLIATTIADEEMQWSMTNGRDTLLDRLQQAGVGQISDRTRESIVE